MISCCSAGADESLVELVAATALPAGSIVLLHRLGPTAPPHRLGERRPLAAAHAARGRRRRVCYASSGSRSPTGSWAAPCSTSLRASAACPPRCARSSGRPCLRCGARPIGRSRWCSSRRRWPEAAHARWLSRAPAWPVPIPAPHAVTDPWEPDSGRTSHDVPLPTCAHAHCDRRHRGGQRLTGARWTTSRGGHRYRGTDRVGRRRLDHGPVPAARTRIDRAADAADSDQGATMTTTTASGSCHALRGRRGRQPVGHRRAALASQLGRAPSIARSLATGAP